jgi:acetyl esterase/lipase
MNTLLAIILLGAAGKFSYPPQMDGARVETYKTVGDTKLNLYIFAPSGAKKAPAIVFFFGGGWSSGSPAQFEVQCRHLASRGMVAICADYRVATRHHVKPTQCLADARSAIRWVRANAAKFGVDPKRVAAGGGSAGGHLAAATAFISEFDEPSEDKKISATPDALVLFNPAVVLAPMEGLNLDKSFGARVPEERLGTKPEHISPAHNIKPGGPPAIIFHGRADQAVPFATVEAFTTKMKAAGNRCELVGYDDQPHGFFNRDLWQQKTLREADKFLVSLGWLPSK